MSGWLAAGLTSLDAGQNAQLARQCPQNQHRRFAFVAQTIQHAHQARYITSQQGIGKLENIVTGDVEYGLAHVLESDIARREQQRQLADFLLSGEQVAFHAFSQKAQCLLIGLQLVHGQPCADPARQLVDGDRIDGNDDTGGFQCTEPFGIGGLTVEFGQRDESNRVGRQSGAIGLQCLAAFQAGFAGGYADIRQAQVAEQREIVTG